MRINAVGCAEERQIGRIADLHGDAARRVPDRDCPACTASIATDALPFVQRILRLRFEKRTLVLRLLPLLLLALTACERDMADQPKYEPLEAAVPFPDAQAARPSIAGTVARNAVIEPVPDKSPLALTEAVLNRGRERFDIYCSPCHGRVGDGQGMIPERGFPPPPSYHTDRLRQAPDRHFYDVITQGYGVMFPYAGRVAPEDRWAIIAYIRALQLSQNATLQDVREAGLADRLGESP